MYLNKVEIFLWEERTIVGMTLDISDTTLVNMKVTKISRGSVASFVGKRESKAFSVFSGIKLNQFNLVNRAKHSTRGTNDFHGLNRVRLCYARIRGKTY